MHSRDEYRDFRGSSDRNDAHENTLVPNVHSDARAVIMELEFYLNIYVKRCAVHHRIAWECIDIAAQIRLKIRDRI